MSKITLDDDDMRQIVQQVVMAVSTVTERRIAAAPPSVQPPAHPPMPERKEPIPQGAADKKWGYVFGVDGIISLETASIYLANAGRTTLDKYADEDKIRRGKMGSKVVFCARSVRAFAESLES